MLIRKIIVKKICFVFVFVLSLLEWQMKIDDGETHLGCGIEQGNTKLYGDCIIFVCD